MSASKLYEWVIEKIKMVVKEEKMEEEKKKKAGWRGWFKSSATLEELEEDIEELLEDKSSR